MRMYTSLLIDFCNDHRPYLCWQVSSILFSMISFEFNFSKSLISRSQKKNLCVTSHHASGLCLTQLDSISLSQKVDLHSLLDLICPSMISKLNIELYIYLLDRTRVRSLHDPTFWLSCNNFLTSPTVLLWPIHHHSHEYLYQLSSTCE